MDISKKWKQIILTLPDNYFFELMKNYLGKIETPFNKHDLVDKLGNFLIKNKANEKILNNLTDTEILILTSIEYINRPTAIRIYNFFLGEIQFIELCDTLKTLEEKLIIYSLNGKIHLSPLYIEELGNYLNPGLLYKSHTIKPGTGKMLWLTDGLILSFLSFLFHQDDVIKSTGTFKRKTFNQIETLFPHTLTGEDGEKKLTLIRRVLHNLNLVRIDGSSLIPRQVMWESILKLDKKDSWLYLMASSTMEGHSGLADRISTIKRIIESLPKDRAFYPDNLKKLINGISLDKKLEDTHTLNSFVDDLITLNLVIEGDDGSISINPIIDLENINPDYGDKHTVILQPNFDVTCKPWITLNDGFYISLFSSLKKMDIYTEMVLTKESFIKGLTITTLKKLIEVLERVTGKEVPDNIILTLKEWEKSSLKALHYEASVLILDEDKDFILKETGVINELIMLNPAPGIYLIRQENYQLAKKLLSQVDILPVDKNHKSTFEEVILPTYTPRPPIKIDWDYKEETKVKHKNEEFEVIIRNLSASKEEKEDLRSRVKRGIIFSKDQIKPGIIKTEFSEAKGVNYQAKLRLIEVSLKSLNNRLEISYVKDLDIHKELILPERIEKLEDKKILHGQKLPEEIPFSIDIGKISLVKRIQTTLF